jgi:glucan biosynthesis protein C
MSSEQATVVAEGGVESAARPGRMRLFFADRIRVVLTVLVVLHHLAVTYGTLPAWYYNEPLMRGPGAAQLPWTGHALDWFVFFNQGFFMGFFFLISGYFVPGSYDRKGGRAFLRDRFRRLGIPLLVAFFVLIPIARLATYDWLVKTKPMPYGLFYVFTLDPGPLWFIAVLLIFGLAYALFRRITRNRPVFEGPAQTLKVRSIVLFTLGLIAVTVVWRLVSPIEYVPVLGLPTPTYLPQYIGMFVIGIVAARRRWIETLPAATAKWGLGVAAGITVVLFPLGMLITKDWTGAMGIVHEIVYGTWDSTLVVSIALGMVVLFRDRFNREGKFARFLAGNAYTVYVIHAVVLVGVGVALAGIYADPLLKFALAALIAVPACFIVSALIRKLPGTSRIL